MSFGAVAGAYDRFRPEPAQAAIGWLLPGHCLVAADLAAGTGLLSRALARFVPRVVAVEPDPRMAAVLRANSPGVLVTQGRGEAIPLRDASADGVFISSAWHWLDPDRAVPEIARVLRDGGRLGVLWTSGDREAGWLRELSWRHVVPRAPAGDAARAQRRQAGLPADGPFRNAETATFRFTRRMTTGDIVAMLATYSGLITADPGDREAALTLAGQVLERRFPGAGEIDVPMQTRCWRADLAVGTGRAAACR